MRHTVAPSHGAGAGALDRRSSHEGGAFGTLGWHPRARASADSRTMLTRTMLLLGAAAALAAPAAATADTTVAPDPAARSVSALDGALVWVSGAYGHERLVYKAPGGPARVPGAPEAKSYASIDLG